MTEEEEPNAAYHGEVVARGATGASEPADRPYGVRDFGLRDINGVEIVVGQDIEHA